MIRIISSIWIFYKKLIVPSIAMSVLIALLAWAVLGSFSVGVIGVAYMVSTPFFHYFIYEMGNYNEYYFYYNIGLSKAVLWVSTLVISLLFGLVIIML